ncbi:MAG: hypothetical protein Harvfovirus8_21 [Harvfovirus sp.]|uniref:Uncharacterized protein n=1 Tax=Harvfovirus sp. TaxID=2487768 RepID=A0A3G5A146_9VIRU|nr:MAG: hypothetical protein Harvfovirus8_21 [Harvfovirus sp.]
MVYHHDMAKKPIAKDGRIRGNLEGKRVDG